MLRGAPVVPGIVQLVEAGGESGDAPLPPLQRLQPLDLGLPDIPISAFVLGLEGVQLENR